MLARRGEVGLTQEGAASRCGVAAAVYKRWEARGEFTSAADMHKVASALRMHPDWLMFGDLTYHPVRLEIEFGDPAAPVTLHHS